MKLDAQNVRGEHHTVTGKLAAQAIGAHHSITVVDQTQPGHWPCYFVVIDYRDKHTDTVFVGEKAKEELLSWLVSLLGCGSFMRDWYSGTLEWFISMFDDRDLQVYKVLNQLDPHKAYDHIISTHPT